MNIIYLDTKGKGGLFLDAMHDINKSTEHSHVKTNMVYTFHRVKTVGSMLLNSFKDLLTEEEFRKCASNPHLGKAWYMLTSEQEITEASDDVAKTYYDETPKDERSDTKVTAVMTITAKTKQHSFKSQFSKYAAIANPKFGDEFLEEITKHWSNNKKPEMSSEKLQLIATACTIPHFKARWLQFWNSSNHFHQAIHFPLKGFTNRELESWLNWASFWVLMICFQRPSRRTVWR